MSQAEHERDDVQTNGCGACRTCRHEEAESPPPAPEVKRTRWGCWLAVLVVACSVGLGLAIAIPIAREAARRMQCHNNMRQLGLAAHNYHDTFRVFPAAAWTDDEGRPRISWRIACFPYYECSPVYNEWTSAEDQAWDSEEHLRIGELEPMQFECPSDNTPKKVVRNHELAVSNYVMVVGPDMVADVNRGMTFEEITDGPSNTLLYAEVTGDDCPAWIEPRDLPQSALENGINATDAPSIGSRHPGGATAVLCDGSVTFLSEEIDPVVLRQLCNPTDGPPPKDSL